MPQEPVKARKQHLQADLVNRDGGLSTSWADAVESFLKEQRRAGRSRRTLEGYNEFLAGKRMRAYLTDTGITTAAEFTEQHLRDLESELQGAGLAPGTVHLRHNQLRTFLKFALSRGMAEDRGVLDVSAPKKAQTAPGIVSLADEARLLKAARCPRDAFLIRFLIGTGLRRAEVLSLTVDDIITGADGDLVHVRQGKGGKDRMVMLDSARMGTELTQATRKYIDRDRPSDTASRALFLTTVKEGDDYQPLKASALQSLLRRLELDTGIECNAHRFRHSFGTRAIQAGVQPFAVQRALGHTTLDMVSVYVHYDDASLADAFN